MIDRVFIAIVAINLAVFLYGAQTGNLPRAAAFYIHEEHGSDRADGLSRGGRGDRGCADQCSR